MIKRRKGFTLIEVSLFLAITGLLFLGVTVGVQNSVYQQRVNDSVQSFAEFLRSVYAEVMNVQNSEKAGRSNKVIYGKLITFGESKDLNGKDLGSDNRMIYAYNVIGDDSSAESAGDTLATLKNLNASVAISKDGRVQTVGYVESYSPRWGAAINASCSKTNNNCPTNNYTGSVLIVRHPDSGIVYTYVMDGTVIQVNDAIGRSTNPNAAARVPINDILGTFLNTEHTSHFKLGRIDFCVNPEGNLSSNQRHDVAILDGARNSSGVEVVPDYESRCVAGWSNKQ